MTARQLSASLACVLAGCAADQPPEQAPYDSAPIARLTNAQYNNAVRDLFEGAFVPVVALPQELHGPGGFTNNAALTAPTSSLAEGYHQGAATVSEAVAAQLEAVATCDAGIDEACVNAYARDLSARAWRRPLTEEESAWVGSSVSAWTSELGAARAAELAIYSILVDPGFVYEARLGQDAGQETTALTSWEIATRMSLLLWNTIPDDELRAAAQSDGLQDRDVRVEQAWRMLSDDRAREGIVEFHRELFDFDAIGSTSLDFEYYADAFPGFEEIVDAADHYYLEYLPALRHEPAVFVAQTLLAGEGTLASILTSNRAWVSADSAHLVYGIEVSGDPVVWSALNASGVLGAGFVEPYFEGEYYPVDLEPSQRAGILTLASFLSATSGPRHPSPVQRGVRILDRLLCRELQPPGDVPPLEATPDSAEIVTNRQKYEAHVANPACAACHAQIDGLGMTFEHYDALGRWRDNDNGQQVDSSGALLGTDVDGEVTDAVAMMHRMANSRTVHDCYALQWFRYAFGRSETAADEPLLTSFQEGFWAAGGNVPELLVNVVAHPAFTHRRNP